MHSIMKIATSTLNKGYANIPLSHDPHRAYCKRIRNLGTMDYSDLPSSKQREVDNNFSAVEKSTDNIVQASLVRDAARTRLKVLQIVNEVARQIVDTFDGCKWNKDITGGAAVGVTVPGFDLKSGATVSLKVYDDIMNAGNSRFGAINLAAGVRGLSGSRQVLSAPLPEDKVTLAGQNYNSSISSFTPALKITNLIGGPDYYQAASLFFNDGVGFLDSKCDSSYVNITDIAVPSYDQHGAEINHMSVITKITDQKTINDRVQIAKYWLDKTQAELEGSDLYAAAYSDLFDLSLKLEHNNRKHSAVRCEAPLTNINTAALDGDIEGDAYAKLNALESIFSYVSRKYGFSKRILKILRDAWGRV
jgi:hypothetical protein